MTPRILTPVFLQKVISRLTSPVDTACSQYTRKKEICGNLICQFRLRTAGFFFCVQDCGYLRCGDQDGSIYPAVLLHVLQHCQMFIRCSWWCVYQQHIQLPPRNIWYELANQSCWVCRKGYLIENTICKTIGYYQEYLHHEKRIPVFLGPLHTTASSGSSNRKPIDMSARVFWASV